MYPKRTGKTLFALIAGIVFLSCLGSAASALPYGAMVTAKQISPTIWSYTIYNTSTSEDYWLCEVSLEASPIDVTTPNGWEANWNGKDGCDWVGGGGPFGAPSPNMIVTGWDTLLGVGQFLGGFEVDFGSREPSNNEVAGMWWGTFSGPSGSAESTGYVMPVPEPSSALCLGTAIFSLGGCLVGGQRKAASQEQTH